MKKQVLAAVAAALVCGAPAHAQSDTTTTPAPYKQVISSNPVGLLISYFNGEYERAISETSTLGLSSAYFTLDDNDLFTIEGKYRYYPQAHALNGFSVGGSLGYGQVSDDGTDYDYNGNPIDTGRDSRNAFMAGIEVDYNWLIGRDRRFFVGTGIGARRLFGGDVDGTAFLPTIRLVNIGFAF